MNITDPIIEVIVDDETVGLSLADFAVDDVNASAYWEQEDPATFKAWSEGKLTISDFGTSAIKLRAFLYAITKAKLPAGMRASFTVDDIGVKWSELQNIKDALSALPDDAAALTE